MEKGKTKADVNATDYSQKEEVAGGVMSRYVNILMDKWFKRILGAEANKEALLAILRELIPERTIMDITYNKKKKRKKSPFADGHDAVFDVECVDKDGSRFVVEMQRDKQLNFAARALFYATFPIQEQVQAQKKEKKPIPHDDQYEYPPVYVISFMNFSLHENTGQVLFRYDLRERTLGDLMTDRLNFIFLEMTNYKKAVPEEGDSFAEKLSYALTHMNILEERPAALIEEVFGLLFAACELDSLTEQEQQTYAKDMTTEADKRNILYCARMEGREEGREEGRAEGLAEGKIATARNFKALGVDTETIIKATGLSKEEVEAL